MCHDELSMVKRLVVEDLVDVAVDDGRALADVEREVVAPVVSGSLVHEAQEEDAEDDAHDRAMTKRRLPPPRRWSRWASFLLRGVEERARWGGFGNRWVHDA